MKTVIEGTGQSSIDTGDIADSSQRVVTHHCPNCEAAARERDGLRARIGAIAAQWQQRGQWIDGDDGPSVNEMESTGTAYMFCASALRVLLAETEAKN